METIKYAAIGLSIFNIFVADLVMIFKNDNSPHKQEKIVVSLLCAIAWATLAIAIP